MFIDNFYFTDFSRNNIGNLQGTCHNFFRGDFKKTFDSFNLVNIYTLFCNEKSS